MGAEVGAAGRAGGIVSFPGQDVVVVGAGPAGAMLAYLLARSGVRVTLVEQNKNLDRSFRGPGFQPSAVKVFDEIGLLPEILDGAFGTFSELSVRKRGVTLLSLDLADWPAPYNYLLASPHPPLLLTLIRAALRYPNFTYLGACAVSRLLMNDGAIAGVLANRDRTPLAINARLVVAADGRFSRIRDLAGIGLTPSQTEFDVVWLDVPPLEGRTPALSIEAETGGQTIAIPRGSQGILVGAVIDKGHFAGLKRDGIDGFRRHLGGLGADLRDHVDEHLVSFDQLHLLDVKIADAEEWTRDGLVLIGDAAHIASPVASQGNNLAIQDAVTLHPIVVRALAAGDGVLGRAALAAYESLRRPEVRTIKNLQHAMWKMIRTTHPLAVAAQKFLLPKLARTPLAKSVQRKLFFGVTPRTVAIDRFVDRSGGPGQPPRLYHSLRVEERIRETDEASSLVLGVPAGLQDSFRCRPGQFVTLRLLVDGTSHTRCYSVSRTSDASDRFEITAKRVAGGVVSNFLCDGLEVGDEVLVLPPSGDFTPPESIRPGSQFAMLAGGSGITPTIAIIRALLAARDDCTISLLYANHDLPSTIFADELEYLRDRHPGRLTVSLNLSRPDEDWEGLSGRLDAGTLTEHFVHAFPPSGRSADYYVCGPPGLNTLALEALEKARIETERIHVEQFTSAHARSPAGARGDTPALRVVAGDPQEIATPETVEIQVNGQTAMVRASVDESVLDAALRARLDAPYSCLSGLCGSCKAKLLDGQCEMETGNGLSADDRESAMILTCQAKPITRTVRVRYP